VASQNAYAVSAVITMLSAGGARPFIENRKHPSRRFANVFTCSFFVRNAG
jgi:hypothetical protein